MKFTEKYNLPEAVNSADTRKVVTLKEPRELKGSDYSQALDQIKKTLDCLLTPDLDNLHSVNGRVVLSKTKVPATLETKEKKMMLLLGKLGGTLKKKSREFREVI